MAQQMRKNPGSAALQDSPTGKVMKVDSEIRLPGVKRMPASARSLQRARSFSNVWGCNALRRSSQRKRPACAS